MKMDIIYMFIILLSLIGCKKSVTNKYTGPPVPLLKTEWILSSIQNTKSNNQTNYPSDAGKKMYVIFSDSLNTISFSGICNVGGCKYYLTPNNDSIKIGPILITAAACKYDEWENYVLVNLDSAFQYKITNNEMIIYSKGTYNLNFIAK